MIKELNYLYTTKSRNNEVFQEVPNSLKSKKEKKI